MKALTTLALTCFLLVFTASKLLAQELYPQLQPLANAVAHYVDLFPATAQYGFGLGRVDSVFTTQDNEPALEQKLRLDWSPTQLTLVDELTIPGRFEQTYTYIIPLSDQATKVDTLLEITYLTSGNFTFLDTTAMIRIIENNRLQQQISTLEHEEDGIEYSSLTTSNRTYSPGTIIEVTTNLEEADGDTYIIEDSTVYFYNTAGFHTGAETYFSEDSSTLYEFFYSYTIDELASNRSRVTYFDSDLNTTGRLEILTDGELAGINTLDATSDSTDFIFARLDDGSDARVRHYLRRDGFGQFSRDTWYYSASISTSRTVPLVQGNLLGPNPIASGQVVQLEGVSDQATLTIYSALGQRVLNIPASAGATFAWPNLSPGTYYVTLSSPGHESRAWTWIGH